jgi:hypothetical protein
MLIKGVLLLNWGPAYNDTNLTSTSSNGAVNVTLGFNFPYQNVVYNNVTINVNGYIQLNGSVLIAAYANSYTTNGTTYGSGVFYRQLNWPNPDLNILTNKIVNTYANFSFFNATNALVITWYNAQLVNTTQLNTFQMILVTDNVESFVIYEYVRLDSTTQGACLSNFPSNNSNFTTYATSVNCTQGGSWVQNVNIGGLFY